jgi:hypothetical protein
MHYRTSGQEVRRRTDRSPELRMRLATFDEDTESSYSPKGRFTLLLMTNRLTRKMVTKVTKHHELPTGDTIILVHYNQAIGERSNLLIRIQQFVTVLLVCLLPASALAADTGAIVRSPAGIRVNGVAAVSGFAVFEGDTIQTRQGSPATISSNGNVIVLAENSAIHFSNSRIELNSGSAAVSTRRGTQSSVTGISIRPTTQNARYELVRRDKEIIIGARQGTIEIADASGTLLLKQGMAASIIPQAPTPATSSSSNSSKNSQQKSENEESSKEPRKRRGAAPIPASTQGIPAAGVSHAKMYAIIGSVLGTAAFVTWAVTRGDTSPTCPSNSTCP